MNKRIEVSKHCLVRMEFNTSGYIEEFGKELNTFCCPICNNCTLTEKDYDCCDCLIKLKQKIIGQVMKQTSITIENTDFEVCRSLSDEEKEMIALKEGDCEHCPGDMKEACNQGEFIEVEKSTEKLIEDGIMMAIEALLPIKKVGDN